MANVRWLAGYRHPRCWHAGRANALRETFSRPAGLMDGVRAVGDPIAVLPVLFHLMWLGLLTADLTSAALHGESLVCAAAGVS